MSSSGSSCKVSLFELLAKDRPLHMLGYEELLIRVIGGSLHSEDAPESQNKPNEATKICLWAWPGCGKPAVMAERAVAATPSVGQTCLLMVQACGCLKLQQHKLIWCPVTSYQMVVVESSVYRLESDNSWTSIKSRLILANKTQKKTKKKKRRKEGRKRDRKIKWGSHFGIMMGGGILEQIKRLPYTGKNANKKHNFIFLSRQDPSHTLVQVLQMWKVPLDYAMYQTNSRLAKLSV